MQLRSSDGKVCRVLSEEWFSLEIFGYHFFLPVTNSITKVEYWLIQSTDLIAVHKKDKNLI